MQDPDPTLPTEQASRISVWTWLKHPWLMLIFGVVASPALWMGIGLWIEHRRALVLAELRAMPGIDMMTMGEPRYPIWLPAWLGDRIRDDWRSRVHDGVSVGIIQPITDHQLDLLNRLPNVGTIRFRELGEASDEALLTLCQTHHFSSLEFELPRRLSRQHYEALARNTNLSGLWRLKGPFDQTAMNALGQIQQLVHLHLTGPLSRDTRVNGLSRLHHLEHLRWQDSQLTDEQFSDLVSSAHLETLWLHDTQLTAKSWGQLASMHMSYLVLESPHIDDGLADKLAQNAELSALQLRGGQFRDRALRKLLESGSRKFMVTETRDLSLDTAKLIGNSSSLTCLTVYGGPHVNDEFLKAMIHKQTYGLSILSSSITDVGVECLKDGSDLTELGLPNSRITDRSLTLLRTLPYLRRLDLRNTAITDDGLRRFSFPADKSGFKQLHLGGTQVSAVAAREFQQRNPSAVVYGVDGIEADGREELWFSPLDAIAPP